jgi:hypothetical protein
VRVIPENLFIMLSSNRSELLYVVAHAHVEDLHVGGVMWRGPAVMYEDAQM